MRQQAETMERTRRRIPTGAFPIVLVAVAALAAACDGDAIAPLANEDPIVLVTSGTYHSCALTDSGIAYCWGAAEWGQVGSGAGADQPFAERVAGDRRFTTLDAGALHTCGLDADGLAHCWGVNNWGQLGVNSTVTYGTPVTVSDTLRFTGISGGWLHTCATTEAGDVFCWGANGQYQLGIGDQADQLVPQRVETAEAFTAVTAGGQHTCALTAAGAAYCWGSNGLGQLGDGTTFDRPVPHPVAGGHAFTMISAGYTHTCGVTTAGTGMCWGSGEFGELGIAGLALRGLPGTREPHALHQGHPFRTISAGYQSTCGVAADDRAWCWGLGVHGQLGTGSTRLEAVPQPLTYRDRSPLTLRDVAVGVTHTCGAAVSGLAYCWGTGERGQLGVGGATQSLWAIRVAGNHGS